MNRGILACNAVWIKLRFLHYPVLLHNPIDVTVTGLDVYSRKRQQNALDTAIAIVFMFSDYLFDFDQNAFCRSCLDVGLKLR